MKAIGIAVIVLLAVIALQLHGMQPPVDPTPGSYKVVPCPVDPSMPDGFYPVHRGWCDDPNTDF